MLRKIAEFAPFGHSKIKKKIYLMTNFFIEINENFKGIFQRIT
jgi:hypothetical protein